MRRLLIAAGAVLLLCGLIGAVLWYRCGIRGCPDVDMLKGYMPDEASVLLDRDGKEVGKLFVERRVIVGVDSLPEQVLNAFVAVEDKRFWTHGGVDWRRVMGALVQNVKSGGIEEGSSTITMQLARNVFPEQLPANRKTIWRKLGEARVAREIESRYSKREILELYLNQIYFGSGAYGIQAAAEEYFGKSATKLELAEATLLAALPRAPSRLNPRANEAAAKEGRARVLQRMAEQGMITAEERTEAADAKIRLRQIRPKAVDAAPYFVEAVRQQLEEELGNALYTEGYQIHTTLDLAAQRVAEQELGRQLVAIESGRFGGYPHPTRASLRADTASQEGGTRYLQGAVVLMDARTGDILALVGGRDYGDSEFNRATQAQRQPGSAFKPFVYAAALSSGFAPTHQLLDRPLRYVLDNGRVWEPGNYNGRFSGAALSMRDALTHSNNVATVRLANEVGMSRVLAMAGQLGLTRLPPHPSVVLGAAEVTPLQLTVAYAAFATLGQQPAPRFVSRVVDRHGTTVWAQQPNVRQVLDPATAFLTTSLLQDVVNRGTGTAVRAVGFRGAAAGKTGTTQDAADVWFVGFTPEIVGTIWIGLDKRQRILRGATGGEIVAPVWGRIMLRTAGGGPGWSPPGGIEERTVDALGAIVSEGCVPQGGTRTEYFLSGTAPTANCYPSGYAWGDTTGTYGGYYDELRDTIPTSSTTDTGWWERLRQRFFGRDTMRVPLDSMRTPPGAGMPPPAMQPPPGMQPPPPPGAPPSSAVPTPRPAPDTGRTSPRRSSRQPLGRPVDVRPRPDTIPS
jgi:penicillin-binding protein 1A